MSDYVYVIEELDTTNQINTPQTSYEINANNVGVVSGGGTTLYSMAMGNQTIPASISYVDSTGNLNSCNLIIASQPTTTAYDKIQNKTVVAYKKVDLTEFNENKNPTTEEIKVWAQYRWKCFLCTQNFDYYKILINHLRDSHDVISDDDVRYECMDCGRVIDQYSQFLNHIRQYHHPNLKLICDVCSRTYARYDLLSRHRETHADQTHFRPRIYNCFLCELTFDDKTVYNHHVTNHPWICRFLNVDGTLCNEKFSTRLDILDHKEKHNVPTNDLNINCEYCSRFFTNCQSYKSHLEVHAVKLPFKCQKCDSRFTTEEQCQSHERRHRLVSCQFCSHTSISEKKHDIHMRLHSNVKKPRTCNECGKKISVTQKHTKFACLRYSMAYRMPKKVKN